MKKDKSMCAGCEDNFYNGNNPYGIKECSNYENAKIIKRKRVHLDQVPPWKQKPTNCLSCYREKGYAHINCEKGDVQC